MSKANHSVKIADGLAQVTITRPEVHNAFDDKLIAGLTATFDKLDREPNVRIVAITGAGQTFCAGGDLNWMQRTAAYSIEQNHADALRMALMLQTLNALSKPTIAVVNGPAYGGGVGVVACCDVAVAADTAKFSLSEVRLGLIPATISPYVIRKIGESAARRYFLTAEVFEAADALRLGLVHEVVPAAQLGDAAGWFIKRLREGGPAAQAASKRLIARVAGVPIDDVLLEDTARRIAAQRASTEGKEGTRAFLEKRKPAWRS